MAVYVVFSDKLNKTLRSIDAVLQTEGEAKRHVKSLRKDGHDEAFSLRAKDEDSVYAWQDGQLKAFPKA